MKINITKKQYRQLLDLVTLGDFMANGTKLPDERNEEIHEVYQYILSFAKDFHMDHLVELEKKYDEYYPTKEYEEQFIKYVNQYDNDSFWGELPIRLASRDIEESGETFETHEEAMQHRFQVESTYEDEFEEHGIKRLRIQKSDQD